MTAVGPATVAAAAATPLVAAAALLIVAAGGVSRSLAAFQCGGAGTGQTIAGVRLDAEQVGNAGSIVSVVARRQLPAFAAEVAVTTAYTESALRNSITQTDHDSEGLFQQRVSIYGREVADNPVSATNAFLDRLLTVAGWRANPVGVDAQAVQRSAYPLRYQPNTALAQQLVSALWPTADLGGAAVCPGAGGAAVGAALANPGSGTTRIPSGLVITGTAQGHAAVMFALKQLGKPYVFGAAGPDAFDCSGLTLAAWASAGIALPHLAADQADQGTPEPADLSAAVGGDLVLIPGSDGTAANPGHVGMIAGYVDRADGRHLYLVQAADVDVPIELTDAHEWDGQIVAVRHIG
jgi:cell wall-associated NlpC family hydrolase